MPHYVGLDASKATTSICIKNEDGDIVREGVAETEPKAIIRFLRGEGRRYKRIGIEAVSFAPWLYEGLAKAGLPVIFIDALHAHRILKGRLNKTDRNDARGIAEMMRLGLYKAVHIKTRESQQAKLLLTARKLLCLKRDDIDNLVRGALLQFGLKIAPGKTYSFADRAGQLAPAAGLGREVIDALLSARRAIDSQVKRLEELVEASVEADPVCERLMTAPGVGPLVALTYRSAIDVPQRFARSRDVGVHLGMTPAAHQSGAVDRKGRISHCGDQATRSALFLAARCVLRKNTRDSALKRWGLRVADERGYMRALIAVGRRLAVILHRMWLTESDFRR